jgi:hypothetical protein
MGVRDVLFGRKKLPGPREDRLFALSTAAVTLQTECELLPGGAAAVTFKPQSSGEFRGAFADIDQLVEAAAASAGSTVDHKTDEYGYEWLIVRDPDIEDLVTSVHVVAAELIAKGFGDQLLAAIFRFAAADDTAPVYWIYGFKRGAFWPFVPNADGKTRDNARELELKAKLENELPIEQDLTRWLALFGAPV